MATRTTATTTTAAATRTKLGRGDKDNDYDIQDDDDDNKPTVMVDEEWGSEKNQKGTRRAKRSFVLLFILCDMAEWLPTNR